MEQPTLDPNELTLQIIDSTSIFNQKLNKNSSIDGTNIIYLAGSSVVFHNIFQNNKKFIPRLTDSQVIGMAFYKSSQNVVALATKSIKIDVNSQNMPNQTIPSKTLNIEIYALGQKSEILAELNENVEFLDMQFYDKKRIILLTKEFQNYYFYSIEPEARVNKRQVNMQNPKRFVSLERKISVLGVQGMKDMDLQMLSLNSQLKFPRIKIDDYVIIDNEYEIILSGEQLYCYRDYELSDSKDLKDFKQNLQYEIQPFKFVHVGRNLLIAHKNSITLTHFVMDNGNLRFLNHYTYKQKIKGGIISMQVSFDQMHLAMAVQLIEKDCTKIENFMFNLSILSSEKKFINPFIRLLPLGTENTEITSLQGVIPFQTYYLTGNNIVNYSFNDAVQKKFKYCLHEVPKQLCAHPLGYQFVCVFDNQVKFYIKIENQIVQVWNQQFICSSAKYMNCGQLLMACLQENFYQIMLYDTNAFQKIRFIPSIYMKHPVTKIQLVNQDSQAIIYCNHDMSIYKLKNGQKTAEFKEKKDKQEILALAYDPQLMNLLASTGNKTLTFSKKIDEISWQFKYQKVIPIQQDITCIQINTLLETVFMGTKSGKILWTDYPLNMAEKQDLTYKIQYKEMKLSQHPVSQIHITNNFKYVFVCFKNEGLVVCKVKKVIKFQGSMRYNEFEISNLNFLQTSSKTWMEAGQQKLKSLLQKRKTVFNDLEEYKKEWQIKKNMKLRMMDKKNKERQLQHVNQALNEVQRVKKEKQRCKEQLQRLKQEKTSFVREKQQKYQKEIILYYNKNIDLQVRKQNVTKRCNQEFALIQRKCKDNINDIEDQLKRKYNVFMQNYQEMKNNLSLFERRFEIERQQAQEILLQLFAEKREKLQSQQMTQNLHSNQLKASITKYKKQIERYNSRKYFLEQKKNYFLEELNYCTNERQQLTQIKQQLEQQLKELEIFTNKKEKRLRKYFKENQILTKYQNIHNNLMSDLKHQLDFIDSQKEQSAKNIVSVQKELSQVAQNNQIYETKIQQLKNKIEKVKNKTYQTADKTRYLQVLIQEMSESLQSLKTSLNDKNKSQFFTSLYREFFIKRKIQKLLQTSNAIDANHEQQEHMEYKIFNSAQNKKKTLQYLEKHKKYLQKNMNLFEKHNKKTDEEMNLNFLKYQTQNYNLIAECNIRKQQTSKKKRILHELIDSVKDTQMIINQLQRQNFDEQPKISRPSSTNLNHRKSTGSIPFIQYKKNKEEIEKSRIKVLRRQESEPSLWKVKQSTYQVRKMLDIQKVKKSESQNKLQRRIKTAMIKNRNTVEQTVHMDSDNLIPMSSQFISNSKKPMTATGKRHQAPFGQYYTYNGVKNKSASKPTTCTMHTSKNKTSLYQ